VAGRLQSNLRQKEAVVIEFIEIFAIKRGSLGREHRVHDTNSFRLIELLIVRDKSKVINKSATTIASNGINKLSYIHHVVSESKSLSLTVPESKPPRNIFLSFLRMSYLNFYIPVPPLYF